MNQPLPLSVLLPTRNVMAALPEHIKCVATWADLAEEIVIVDSGSDDGTPEFIQQNLKHPKIKVLSHPPGLYASWNYGIRHLSGKYTYISTIGDAMSRDGLFHLFATAEKFDADVTLSNPRFLDKSGHSLPDFKWPIHKIIDELAIKEPILLPTDLAVYFAIKFGVQSILGSSASNLYRTEILRKNPFPEDFGSAGDTAWGILNAHKARFAITPQQFSSFVVDPKYQSDPSDGFPTKIFWVCCKAFTEIMADRSGQITESVRAKLCQAIVESGEHLLHEGRPFETMNGKLQLWAEGAEARYSAERKVSQQLKERLENSEAKASLVAKELKQQSEILAQKCEQLTQIESLLGQQQNISEKLKTELDQERTENENLRQALAKNEVLLTAERRRIEEIKKQWWIRFGRHSWLVNWDRFYRS